MGAIPCQVSSGWDLLHGSNTPDRQIEHAQRAVAGCWRCPIMRECREQAQASPPDLRCVQGGLIFDRSKPGGRRGLDLGRWSRTISGTKASRATADGPPCQVCSKPMLNDGSGRRYCSTICKRAARKAREAGVPAGLCAICLRPEATTAAERSAHGLRHAADRRAEQSAKSAHAAVALLNHGMNAGEVARLLKVHKRTVQRWKEKAA